MDLVHTVVHGPGSPCSVYVCFHDVCLCHKTNILPVLVPFDQYNIHLNYIKSCGRFLFLQKVV